MFNPKIASVAFMPVKPAIAANLKQPMLSFVQPPKASVAESSGVSAINESKVVSEVTQGGASVTASHNSISQTAPRTELGSGVWNASDLTSDNREPAAPPTELSLKIQDLNRKLQDQEDKDAVINSEESVEQSASDAKERLNIKI